VDARLVLVLEGRPVDTQFAGIEGRPEGNAFFCGEHTSIDFQGYLNGAVETGQRAAREVLDSIS
jgi:monoamine oxidase